MRAKAPRRNQKRSNKAGRRIRARHALAAVGIVALLVGVPLGARAAYRHVAAMPLFTVSELKVSGLKFVRAEDFMDYIGDPTCKSILSVDLARLLGRASSHPWVKRAYVKRELPDTIRVEVVERVPCAVAETGSGRFLVDTEGLALARITGEGWDHLPVIGYEKARGLKVVDKDAARELKMALELLRCVMGEPSEPFAGAQVSIDAEGTPCLNYGGVVIKVGRGDYEDKVRRLCEVSQDIRNRGASPEVIDLRFPGKVVVKDGRARG